MRPILTVWRGGSWPNRLRVFRLASLVFVALLCTSLLGTSWSVSQAAAILSIAPLTWNVVGLDSADPTRGPEIFPAGARVCNKGDSQATNLVVTFYWDSTSELIRLAAPDQQTLSALPAAACADFYFLVAVQRSQAAYGAARGFHIEAFADQIEAVGTPQPREIYVERLVAQDNPIPVQIDGPAQVLVGQTYTYAVLSDLGETGKEQFNGLLTFPANVFQILAVDTQFSMPDGALVDSPYADACGWDSDPASPTYRSCAGPQRFLNGQVGGRVVSRYTVKVLAPGSAELAWAAHWFSGDGYAYDPEDGLAAFWVTAQVLQETPTETPTSSETPTETPTSSETPTETLTPVNTVTETPTPSATATSSSTATPSGTPTFTGTAPTASSTPTSTSTPTFTGTPPPPPSTPTTSQTPTPSGTLPTVTPTSSETPTDTPTVTPTYTGTPPTSTPTPSRTLSPTATGTITANPTISKSVSATTAKVGDTLTFTIRFTHRGSGPATDVALYDDLGNYLDFSSVSVSPTTGSSTDYDTGTDEVWVDIDTISVGSTVTVVITARVKNNVTTSRVENNTVEIDFDVLNRAFSRNITSPSFTLQPASTLPGTGFAPSEPPVGHFAGLPSVERLLIAALGMLSLGLGIWARLRKAPGVAWYAVVGLGLLLVAGLLSLPGLRSASGEGDGLEISFDIATVVPETPAEETPVATTPQATAVIVADEGPIILVATEDVLDRLPDFPVPTPPVELTPSPTEDQVDTSAVVHIQIPAIGVDNEVKYVPFDGLTWMIAGLQNEVAWLGDTSWPGLGGNTVLAGHVILRNGAKGPFQDIRTLQPGMEIIVTTEHKIYVYEVRDSLVVAENDVSVTKPGPEAQLTLITCEEWQPTGRFYDKRRVVIAELISVRARQGSAAVY